MIARYALRALALAIAIAGIIDPAVTSARPMRPTIALIDTTRPVDGVRASGAAERVSTALAPHFLLERGPSADADATLIVGHRLPDLTRLGRGPAFVLTPAVTAPRVRITRADIPRTASLDATVPVGVTVRVEGARGRQLELVLSHQGVALDRVVADVAADVASIARDLTFVGTAPGVSQVTIAARVIGSDAVARTDGMLETTTRPWSVLFFDRRPSWSSTFVRRAIERDRRFAVTSRTRTSTNVSTEMGPAPASLESNASLDAADVIVVGAPGALSATEVTALEAFARRRGGSIITLLDEPATGALAGVIGIDRWQSAGVAEPVAIEPAMGGLSAIRATELALPERLPAGAEVMARVTLARAERPVVIDQPLGLGHIIVSGAIDAWRYRGDGEAFERFWQFVTAQAAGRAARPIEAELGDTLLAPGEMTSVRVRLRDLVATSPGPGVATAEVTAHLETPAGASPVRLWPTGGPGEFTGELRAPGDAGVHRLVVSSEGADVSVALIVANDRQRAEALDEDALRALASTRGGQVFEERDLAALDRALGATLHPEHRPQPWWPMRSVWWIVPFVGALGGEWWLRRRGDLR